MGKLTDAVGANNFIEVQKLLDLEYKNSPLINEEKDNGGFFALYTASYFGYVKIIEALLKAGAQVNQTDKYGVTPLYIAAQNGHTAVIEVLIKAGALVNQPNNEGTTPLWWAAQRGYTAMVEVLVRAGALVNQPENEGTTPLWIATQNGHIAIIEALIKAGALVNQACNDGTTPLHKAVIERHIGAIDVLIKASAQVNQTDKNDNTPLHMAAYNDNTAAIEALVKAGAQVNQTNKSGETPLLMAAYYGHIPAIEALVKVGAQVNQTDKNDNTPLFHAAENGRKSAISLLLKAAADVNYLTHAGKTALDIAKEKGHAEIVKLLLQHNAKEGAVIKKDKELAQKQSIDPAFTKPQEPPTIIDILHNQITSTKQPLPSGSKQKQSTTPQEQKAAVEFMTQALKQLKDLKKENDDLKAIAFDDIQSKSKNMRAELQKQFDKQTEEMGELKEDKEKFEARMAQLEAELKKKATLPEQATIRADLCELKDQLENITMQLEILSNESDAKKQKKKSLMKFQDNPNLLDFYLTVQIRLEEVFISFKTVAGGFVDPTQGKLGIAASVAQIFGDHAEIVPIIGSIIGKFLKWGGQVAAKVDNIRQKNSAMNASRLVTLSEVSKYAENTARQLTECYEEQLRSLATPEEAQDFENDLKKRIKSAKKQILKSVSLSPAKQMAAFGVVWMVEQLMDAHNMNSKEELDKVLVSYVLEQQPPQQMKQMWQEVTAKLGFGGLITKGGVTWSPEQAYTMPGIKVKTKKGDAFQFYYGKVLQPDKFGWRIGTDIIVKLFNLEVGPMPVAGRIVQDHGIHQDVKGVKNQLMHVSHQNQNLEKRVELKVKLLDLKHVKKHLKNSWQEKKKKKKKLLMSKR